jgi:hypothetical protein
MEELRKNHETLSQDSRFPSRYLNPGPPEQKTGLLTTQLQRSLVLYVPLNVSVLRIDHLKVEYTTKN